METSRQEIIAPDLLWICDGIGSAVGTRGGGGPASLSATSVLCFRFKTAALPPSVFTETCSPSRERSDGAVAVLRLSPHFSCGVLCPSQFGAAMVRLRVYVLLLFPQGYHVP
jgi:hypothetical protein